MTNEKSKTSAAKVLELDSKLKSISEILDQLTFELEHTNDNIFSCGLRVEAIEKISDIIG